jgi:glycosyltransferase involved in cell wall biosynthesis
LRILWHSHSPLLNTGYGVLTQLWLPKLQEMGHDVIASSFQGLNAEVSLYKGIRILNVDDQKYGSTVLGQVARNNEVDVVITLMDMWVLPPHEVNGIDAPVIHWSPVDCYPLGQLDTDYLRRSTAYPVATSQWGKKVFEEAGFEAGAVPGSFDASVYFPDEDRRDAKRRDLGIEDKFVVGINAANVERKALPEQLIAFSRLWKNHPDDVVLFVNTNMSGAITPQDAMRSLDLAPEMVRWSVPGWQTPEDMADWYRMVDVLSACPHADGFSLPVAEAQACGTPVIITDNPPVNEEPGLLARKVKCEPMWSSVHRSWWVRPSIDSIHEQLEDAFAAGRKGPDQAAAAHVQQYTVDNVAPLWTQVLEDVVGESDTSFTFEKR